MLVMCCKITCVLIHYIKFCCFPACGNGKVQMAEVLIAHGAKLNAVNFNNFTPLHCAVSTVSFILAAIVN
jgi:ankyrin repeat protein